jgi:serine/threonine protein kinase/dipeptidyl aminopeptidase/acylaminoacyl peptidase
MSLSSGTRLGPYEIQAPIGAGGMGEVYRARDTRLERTVAVKVLPAHLSTSPEVRQRFEREAKTISSLSHPHICALYDVGNQDGVEFLVMEYLEGETLSEKLAKGPLAFDQVLRYGLEVADALDKAHRQGIVHRDLKPGNVMITKSGVKLLDFGLAKAVAPAAVRSGASLTALPTQVGKDLTAEGTILGTFQYMAPEQLDGRDVDARTDIFAFGSVLYEMATGQKAFSGRGQASLISSIMTAEPVPVSSVAPMTPPAFDRVVRTCLAKDPDDRWQTARDVDLQLQGIQQDRSAAIAPVEARRPRLPTAALGLGLAVVSLVVGALIGRAVRPRTSDSPIPLVRSSVLPPPGTQFRFFDANTGLAVSPDGRRIAFTARDADDRSLLWVRELDSLEPYVIPGSDEASFPFWSPDGRRLGFFSYGTLKVVEASPSAPPPTSLAPVLEARGGAWAPDGTIVFSPGGLQSGPRGRPLLKVSSSGGRVTEATVASGSETHRWPSFLPDGRHFLYQVRFGAPGKNAIFAGSLDSKDRREILAVDTDSVYGSGYLLFRRNERLVAAPFDPERLQIRGDPVELVKGIEYFPPTSRSIFSVGADVLAYASRSDARLSRIAWFDRAGHELGQVGSPGIYIGPRLSPDGRKLAVSVVEQLAVPPDVWVFDTSLGTSVRSTERSGPDLNPVFSPDGARIFFAGSQSGGTWGIFETPTSGTGESKAVLESPLSTVPTDISSDGRFLLYREFSPATRGDLKVLPLGGERRPFTFVASPYDEEAAMISPDGRWVAYVSEETGRKEVYVATFPQPTRRHRISTEGGTQPRWSRDGRELFFVTASRTIMATPFESRSPDLPAGPARRLFDVMMHRQFSSNVPYRYDVAPDGRFLIVVRFSDEPPPLILVTNWQAGLEHK